MTIGIISAMTSEVSGIRSALGTPEIKKLGISEFYIYTIGDKKIISVCSGVAKVNAAVAAQMLISEFKCDILLNAGVAGGMKSEIGVCDIVIATDVMHHDVTMRFLENYPPYTSEYKCDEALVGIACRICDKLGYPYFKGRVVSGEQFISDAAVKNRIISEFAPSAVEMECAAVGQCAHINGVPFAAIKCISDNADDEGEMSFEEFEKIAAEKVAGIVLNMLDEI